MKTKRLASIIGALLMASAATAQAWPTVPVINEIFFDAAGSLDYQRSYIEIKGPPGMVLNDYYLVFTENENTVSSSNPSGNVDGVFNLSGMTIGTNGYLVLLPKDFDRGTASIAPGTAIYQNSGTGQGFGSGASSSIGFTCQSGNGDIENGAFTALLIHTTQNLPVVNEHLDGEYGQHTGHLSATLTAGWDIVDSIGQAEPGEESGYTYGAKVFFSGSIMKHKDSVTTNVFTDLEPEYLFRWGDRTAGNASDWAMANLTDNTFVFVQSDYWWAGYPVSGGHVPANPLPGELVRGATADDWAPGYQTGQRNMAPEGTIVQNTIGRPNYPIPDGDLNQDGVVDYADVEIVLSNLGSVDMSLLGNWEFGDPSGDGVVDYVDLEIVLSHLGEGSASF